MTDELRDILEKPRRLRIKIKETEARITSRRDLLFPKGQSFDGERVSSSPQDKIPDLIGDIVELEAEHDQLIIDLQKAEQKIMDITAGLKPEEAAVVRIRHIEFKQVREGWRHRSFEEIGDMLGYSETSTRRMYDSAITKMAEMAD